MVSVATPKFWPALNVLTPRPLFSVLAACEVTVSLMSLATTVPWGPLARLSEARLRLKIGIVCPLTVAVSCLVLVLTRGLVSVTLLPLWLKVSAPVSLTGADERRDDDLSAVDWEDPRGLGGRRRDCTDGDAGVLEGGRTLGLTTTSVFFPTTVAGAEAVVVVEDLLELVLAVAVPLADGVVLLELLPQAAAASAAAPMKAMADSRRKLLRGMGTSPLLTSTGHLGRRA